MKKLISIVIPVFNEEDSVPKLTKALINEIENLTKYSFEIILVENGSSDNSFHLLLKERKKDKRIKILQLAKNFGCDGGIIAGLNFASGDAAIVIMADLQEDPKLMHDFLMAWEKGYEVVYGVVQNREGVPIIRRLGTYIFYKAMTFLTGNFLPENVSDFRLLDKKVYTQITSMPEHNKFFRGLVTWAGFRQIGIPFIRTKRVAGVSKANLKTILDVAANGVFSFSDFPLRLPLFLGLLSVIFTVLLFFMKWYETGFALILFSLVMLVIYLQNEYLKRILDEVRNRPNYIVQNKFGLDSKNPSLK